MKRVRLPMYRPPSGAKLWWVLLRAQGKRLQIGLAHAGILPVYLGETVRWRFLARRFSRGFRRERYTCHLRRLVRELGPAAGPAAWERLADSRPPRGSGRAGPSDRGRPA